MKKSSKMGVKKFVPASGACFGSKDAPIIGEALQRIADANRVDDIRSLSPRSVFELVKLDPEHPLRPYYNWNVKEAAEAHWIAHTSLLIRSIHVIEVNAGRRDVRHPMFVVADAPIRGGGNKRSRVLHEDVIANDPVFMSAISVHVRRIQQAVAQLEKLISCRRAPTDIEEMCAGHREVIDRYNARGERAAE